MATARVSPIATLFPGYFALVMATGIIAVAASQQDIDWLADVLYVVAVAAYVVLLVLLLIRVVRYWQRFAADLTNHVQPLPAHPVASAAAEHAAQAAGVDVGAVDVEQKLEAVQTLTVNLVQAGALFLMLLPAVLSLIPGAVNGCLRVKSAFPAAQVPGE